MTATKTAGKLLFFISSVLFSEMMLRLATSTVAEISLPLLLFSAAFGVFLSLPLLILKSGKINRIIGTLLLLCIAVASITEAVLYRSFGYYYPPETVLDMADDVAGGFGGTALSSVLSALPYILLLLVPTAAFLILYGGKRRKLLAASHRLFSRAVTLAVCFTLALTLHFLGVATVNKAPESRGLYTQSFDFNEAAKEFGLFTALRLNCKYARDTDIPNANGYFDFHEKESDTDNSNQDNNYPQNITNTDLNAIAAKEPESTGLRSLCDFIARRASSRKNRMTGAFKDKNLVFICAEALSPYSVTEELTPTLHRLSREGITFDSYYAPTFGESTSGGEYALLLSQIPKRDAGERGMSMTLAADNDLSYSLPSFFARNGYFCNGYHNNSYTYYSRDKTHTALGMNWYGCGGCSTISDDAERFDLASMLSPGWPRSDVELIDATANRYISKSRSEGTRFFTYYMTVSGHNNYSFSGNAIARKNESLVSGLNCSNTLKAYLATQIELDRAVERLIELLDSNYLLDDTVIVIANDHYPYGLSSDWAGNGGVDYLSELYGRKISGSAEREKGYLCIYCKGMTESEEISHTASSFDVLPTLLNMFGFEYDSRFLCGCDVYAGENGTVFFSDGSFITEYGEYNDRSKRFTPKPSAEITNTNEYLSDTQRRIQSLIRFSKLIRKTNFFKYLH